MRHKKQYLKSLITILIPTHNRPHLLKRALDYYDDFGVKLIVGDSSEAIFEGAQNYNCEYHYCPNMVFSKKLMFLIHQLKTPYYVTCADDDLTVKQSIIKCVAFLENHQNYSCAFGNILRYKDKKTLLFFDCDTSYGYVHKKSDFNEKEPVKRVLENFKDLVPSFYAVSRTKNGQKLCSYFLSYNLSSTIFIEFWTYYFTYFSGYIKVLPILYTVRGHLPTAFQEKEIHLFSQLCSKDVVGFIQMISDHLKSSGATKNLKEMNALHEVIKSIWEWADIQLVKRKSQKAMRLTHWNTILNQKLKYISLFDFLKYKFLQNVVVFWKSKFLVSHSFIDSIKIYISWKKMQKIL